MKTEYAIILVGIVVGIGGLFYAAINDMGFAVYIPICLFISMGAVALVFRRHRKDFEGTPKREKGK